MSENYLKIAREFVKLMDNFQNANLEIKKGISKFVFILFLLKIFGIGKKWTTEDSELHYETFGISLCVTLSLCDCG